ncbi:MAG: hypothetical protein M0P71_06380 [Melioribacteraceae bacterium]|nr:hypothetical protein [Melioribacteraceae bacterium]
MPTATLQLHNLISASNKMLSSLIQLHTNDNIEKIKDTIGKLRRRSHIMSLLYDKYIVAVAGLQGVGKSTLIRSLYGYTFETSPFMENQGQGETIPILVTESENAESYFVHRAVEKDGKISIEILQLKNKEEFQKLSHAYGKDDLLLEVTVPYKIFNSSNKSFLLLPGFQANEDYLKELTFSALRAASNCLILFNQQCYAHKNNKDLIDLLNREFREADPLFLITWSDNDDSNVELREKVQRDLGNVEEDRIIRTGIEGPKNWKEDVLKSMNRYCIPKDNLLETQNNNINNLIGEYNKLIASIRVELRRADVDEQNREYQQVERVLREFRAASDEIKSDLKQDTEETFRLFFERINKNLTNELINQFGGFDGMIRGIKDYFSKSIKVRKNLEELISRCVRDSNNNNVEDEFKIVLNRVANEKWRDHNIVMNLPTIGNTKYETEKLLSGENGNSEESIPLKEDTINDIYAILHPEKKDFKFSTDLMFNIRVLPLLILENFRFNYILANGSEEGLNVQGINNQKTIIEMYEENQREVVIGLGALFGLDILEGNGVDLFGLVAHNAANGGSVMAAASFNWILAALAGGGMIIYILDQLNKSVDRHEQTARFVIDKMQDFTINKFLKSYDDNMQRFENILRDLLIRRFDLADEYANIQNCYSQINYLEKTVTEIEEKIAERI